ncbi:MAG: proline--tRNA ligase, partial [bacterium]|nr:proline--tRNA ligase [bacterium]
MRLSKLFSQTLREAPADAEVKSHQLLVRAGFIRQLASGIFSYLPMARRTLNKIGAILREEIDNIGGQEITMPVVHPADIWKETGRWYQIGSEMGRFLDKAKRDMVLAMTHEEVVADLVRKEISSYKQLPCLVYHLQTKWRDDPRPRAGLIRVREFTMKDSYSLDVDLKGLDKQYRDHYQAYFNIFNRCALPSIAVSSDVGVMGGSAAHEFMYLASIGEDTLVICDACGYVENRQIARFKKAEAKKEEMKEMAEVETPGKKTIEELSGFMNLPQEKFAKAVFFAATVVEDTVEKTQMVCAVIRGDMDINETKLTNAVKAKALRFAQDEEIRAIGSEPGYGSPIGIKDTVVVIDNSITPPQNLVAGANKENYHIANVNFKRDFKADIVTDLSLAADGHQCIERGKPLTSSRGVEIGNIFKLGTRYTEAMGCTFQDQAGKNK